MAEIYLQEPYSLIAQGFDFEGFGNYPVETKLFVNGEPVTPSSVTVDVYTSWLGAYQQTHTAPLTAAGTNLPATPIETDIGVYVLNIPTSLLHPAAYGKTFRLIWKYVVNGVTHKKQTWVEVVTPYVSLVEAADQLGFGSDSNDPNHKTFKELKQAEKYARMMIDSYTNQKFSLYGDTISVMGSDSDTLLLPRRIATIINIKSGDEVWFDDRNLVNKNVIGYSFKPTYSSFGITIDKSYSLTNDVYIANGMIPPSINAESPNIFKRGNLYHIEGVFGWDHVPPSVEEAAIELMKMYFSKDRVWKDRYVKKISTTDWDFQYSSEAFSGTGSSYADKLLDDYVVTQMVIL